MVHQVVIQDNLVPLDLLAEYTILQITTPPKALHHLLLSAINIKQLQFISRTAINLNNQQANTKCLSFQCFVYIQTNKFFYTNYNLTFLIVSPKKCRLTFMLRIVCNPVSKTTRNHIRKKNLYRFFCETYVNIFFSILFSA